MTNLVGLGMGTASLTEEGPRLLLPWQQNSQHNRPEPCRWRGSSPRQLQGAAVPDDFRGLEKGGDVIGKVGVAESRDHSPPSSRSSSNDSTCLTKEETKSSKTA